MLDDLLGKKTSPQDSISASDARRHGPQDTQASFFCLNSQNYVINCFSLFVDFHIALHVLELTLLLN
jgi:hypothetical protein